MKSALSAKTRQKKPSETDEKTATQKRLASFNRQKNLLLMLAAFANTLLISLFIGAGFIAQQLTVVDNPSDVANAFGLVAYMVVAAAVMLLVLKFYKGNLLFKLLEYGLIASSASIFGMAFLPGYEMHAIIAAVAIRLAFAQAQNVLLLASCIIVGSLLAASLDFIPVAVFAILLSAYDYIAVFRTKHMVKLAEGLGNRDAAFSIKIGVASTPKAHASEAKKENPAEKNMRIESPRSGIELGLGDFMIGIMLSVAALKIGAFPAFGYALASVLGATAGLALMFYLLEKKGGYFPAVPPIAAGSLLCIAAYWIIRTALGTV
ncbi:MAG: presenilin family intramembrane aspartyl protease [Candidatus Micrarchaeia archaeon]|jgi:presenilin-like A22 family membrane protease